MGCGKSKERNDESKRAATNEPYAVHTRTDPEFFDEHGEPRVTPASAEFVRRALEEGDPLAVFLLDQWCVVQGKEQLIRQRRLGSHQHANNGNSSYATSRAASEAPPSVMMREDGTSTAGGGTTTATSGTGAGTWVNTDLDDPLEHEEVEKTAGLFCQHVRMDLVHRGWHGKASFDVVGHPADGVLTVTVAIDRPAPNASSSGASAATGADPQPSMYNIEAYYHAAMS